MDYFLFFSVDKFPKAWDYFLVLAGWSNGKTVLCKRTIDGSIPSLASNLILKKLKLIVDIQEELNYTIWSYEGKKRIH